MSPPGRRYCCRLQMITSLHCAAAKLGLMAPLSMCAVRVGRQVVHAAMLGHAVTDAILQDMSVTVLGNTVVQWLSTAGIDCLCTAGWQAHSAVNITRRQLELQHVRAATCNRLRRKPYGSSPMRRLFKKARIMRRMDPPLL